MRCERLHATFDVRHCLRRQRELEIHVKNRRQTVNGVMTLVPNAPAHPCFKCEQGKEIKAILNLTSIPRGTV